MSTVATSLFARPPKVEQVNYRKYIVILITCITGILAYLGFAFVFYTFQIKTIYLIDLLSAVLWVLAGVLNYRGYHSSAIFLVSIDIVISLSLTVAILGLDHGFQLYLWPVACLAVVNPGLKKVCAGLVGFSFIILFALLKYFFSDVASHEQIAQYADTFYIINAIVAGIPVILAVTSVREINESQERVLTELATVDELTGLYNRRYVRRYLNKYYRGADLRERHCCVVLGDIDHFKNINDRYGHDVGDEILRVISTRLKKSFRDTDVICRWGGEEFLILLNKTKPEKAHCIVNRIRQEISRSVNTKSQICLDVTMSFGIASTADSDDSERLIKLADENLYKAKNNGRNCVVTSSIVVEKDTTGSLSQA